MPARRHGPEALLGEARQLTLKSKLRDGLIALSVANLTFLRTWNELLTYTDEQAFFLREIPNLSQATAAALNVVLLAIAFFGLIRLFRVVTRRWGDKWGVAIAPFILLAPANAVSGILSANFPAYAPQTLLSGLSWDKALIWVAALTVLAAVSLRWPGPVLRAGGAIALQFIFLVPIEAGLVVWHLKKDNRSVYRVTHLAGPQVSNPERPPVFLLLVDELDYRLLFEDRPRGLSLPAFDRLQSECLSARRAFSPSSVTLTSVPSILSGEHIYKVAVTGPASIDGEFGTVRRRLHIEGGDTLFGAARALGYNVNVVGWYFPYCRVFGPVLSTCHWFDRGVRINVDGTSFKHDFINQAQSPYETATYSPFSQSVLGRHRILNAAGVERETLEILNKPDPGFLYVHHMATHAPFFYDRTTRTFSKRNAPVTGYVDALAWADSLLEKFRGAMESAGTWDRAIVLVTSDHFYRNSVALDGKPGDRVPWILKLPGQNTGVALNSPMHTIITRRFMESAMRGEIRTYAEAVDWIERNEASLVRDSEVPPHP